MRRLSTGIAMGMVLVAGCASEPERQWMKVNQRYSVEEFRHDHAQCSRGGKLDDACMRNRGWVDVKEPAAKPPADVAPDPRWSPRR